MLVVLQMVLLSLLLVLMAVSVVVDAAVVRAVFLVVAVDAPWCVLLVMISLAVLM